MTVEFRCGHCQQRLSAKAEQSGRQVQCPRCHGEVVVPDAAATEAAREIVLATVPELGTGSWSQPGIETGTPRTMEPPPTVAGGAPATIFDEDFFDLLSDDIQPELAPPGTTHRMGIAPLPPAAYDVDYVAVPRWLLILHGVLLAVLTAIGFGLGYAVGSRGEPASSAGANTATRFAVDFLVTLGESADQTIPDGDAVVLLFPAQHMPARTERPALGELHPLSPRPAESDVRVAAVEAIGGAFGRAESSGRGRLIVPRTGAYFALFISRGASRGSEERVDNRDLAALQDYCVDAEQLLGQQMYAWERLEITPETQLRQHFNPRTRTR